MRKNGRFKNQRKIGQLRFFTSGGRVDHHNAEEIKREADKVIEEQHIKYGDL